MDIHRIQILDDGTQCVFFDKSLKESWDPQYSTLFKTDSSIITQYFLSDDQGNKYVLIPNVLIDGVLIDGKQYLNIGPYRKLCQNMGWEFKIADTKTPETSEKIKALIGDKLEITTETSTERISTDFGDGYLVDLEELYSGDKKYPLISILKDRENKLIGLAYIVSLKVPIDIDKVLVKKEYQGRGYCKKLLTYFIGQLKLLGIKSMTIYNASRVGPPIGHPGEPACKCYFSSGIDNGYNVYYNLDEEGEKKELTYEMCKENPNVCAGAIYYYELKQSQGGGIMNRIEKGNKNILKRRTNKRRTNKRRKYKRRKYKRRTNKK